MIYPLGKDDVLRTVAVEKLVQRMLTVPTTQTAPKDLSTYKDPPGIWNDLADG